MLSETANVLREKGQKRGALIVIGDFASIGSVKGAIPPSENPFEGLFLSAGDKVFQRMLLQNPALEEGAAVGATMPVVEPRAIGAWNISHLGG